jgi:hypothetical protein
MNALCDYKLPPRSQINRLSLVGYTLRRRAVDCSRNCVLDSRAHHLKLQNSQALFGVKSYAVSPGYVKGLEK